MVYYYGGEIFTPGCVLPIYYPLTPLGYFSKNGLPFFSYSSFFIYFFIYQLVVYYFFYYKLFFVYFCYSLFCIFNIFPVDYYWDKSTNLSFDQYKYKEKYVFPEHMFFINNIDDITNLVRFAKNQQCKVIAGVGWYEKKDDWLIEKNGVIIINQKGNFSIFGKRHYLRFFETGTSCLYLSHEKKVRKNIFICSEFFLNPLQKLNKEIIVASTIWTNTFLTFFYKNIMKRIYDLALLK